MKKQINNLALIMLLFLSGTAIGQINLDQQVIGSAGGFHQVVGGNSYSYTVGEPLVQTVQSTFSTTYILTQGFQQSFSLDSVLVYPTPIPESCPGAADGSISITGVAGCPAPYTLVVTNLANATIVPQDSLVAGTYSVTITGNNGCFYTTDISVGIFNALNCDVSSQVGNESCPGKNNGSIFISNVQGYVAPFSFVVKTTTSDSSVVDEATLSSGTYSVVITDANGSIYIKELEVGLDSDLDCDLTFYSGITPNGDGNNDIWEIDNIDLFPENTVQIFNRWGAEVWFGEKYDNELIVWSGLDKNGVEMADATYFYVAIISGKTYKGFIELTR